MPDEDPLKKLAEEYERFGNEASDKLTGDIASMDKEIAERAARLGIIPAATLGPAAVILELSLQPDLLAALDKFAAEQNNVGRPEAVRLLVKDALIGQGFLAE